MSHVSDVSAGQPEAEIPRLDATPLPEYLWLGMALGEWPITTFTSEAHAVSWLEGDQNRRLWLVQLAAPREQEAVRERAFLRAKEDE